MQDRRHAIREKVMYGGIATTGEHHAARECVVRSISDTGASLEFRSNVHLPKDRMSLSIAKKSRHFLARVIWSRDNVLGIAFESQQPADARATEFEAQLRSSEKKKRALQRQIKQLIG
jgi:hypothetical protein